MPTYTKKTKGEKVVKAKDFNRKVSSAMNRLAEVKHMDYVLTAGAVTGTPTIVSVFDPVQNVTDTGRTGDFVRATRTECRFTIIPNVAMVESTLFRLMLIQWYDQVAPVIANILQVPGSGMTSMHSYDRIRDNNNMKVLYDKVFSCHKTSDVGGEAAIIGHKILKYFKKKIYFNSAGNPPSKGGLYLVYFSDATIADDCPFFNYYHRTEYVDY